MRKWFATALICVMAVCLLAGCGETEEEFSSVAPPVHRTAQDSQRDTKTEKKANVRMLGIKANGAFEVLLNNRTGQGITGLKVGTDQTIGNAKNLLEGAAVYANEEQVELFYKPEASADAAGSGEKALTPAYLLHFRLQDGTEHTLHAFPFGDIEEGSIRMQDGVAYLSYLSKSTGDAIETLDSEKAVIDQAKEAAEKAAAEAAEAEKKAAEEAKKKAEADAAAQAAAASEASKSADTNASGSNAAADNNAGNSQNTTQPASTGNSGSSGSSSSSSGSSTQQQTTSTSSTSTSSGSSGSGSSSSSAQTDSGNDTSSSDSSSGTSSGGSSNSNGSDSTGVEDDDSCLGDGLTY